MESATSRKAAAPRAASTATPTWTLTLRTVGQRVLGASNRSLQPAEFTGRRIYGKTVTRTRDRATPTTTSRTPSAPREHGRRAGVRGRGASEYLRAAVCGHRCPIRDRERHPRRRDYRAGGDNCIGGTSRSARRPIASPPAKRLVIASAGNAGGHGRPRLRPYAICVATTGARPGIVQQLGRGSTSPPHCHAIAQPLRGSSNRQRGAATLHAWHPIAPAGTCTAGVVASVTALPVRAPHRDPRTAPPSRGPPVRSVR